MEHKTNIKEGAIDKLISFDLSTPEYNQETYSGRFMTLFRTQNPFFTFASTSKINAARKMVAEYEKTKEEFESQNKTLLITKEEAKNLRNAQYLIGSSVHPDTNQILAPYQRFCSYSVINIPILFGMILSKQTTGTVIFWQWINQTYNAAINYSNRNASSDLGTSGLLKAYSAAVISSISIGLGMKRLLAPYSRKFKGPGQLFFNFIINVSAIGSAGVINVLIMRSEEMKKGITLTDSKGNEVGKSPIIGKDAVTKTALSRVILPIPPLLLPTIAFFFMEKRSLVPKSRIAKALTESVIFFCSMVFAPPMCCALFKQNCSVEVTKLEKEFHHLIDIDGKPIAELYYNKGL
eukprot:CAMPEP_0196999536 /NCGR_PEP_ID=MMETSP1380-20130617/4692_1 /TAXON_ID=5936 /ORGANISM="Euplotes crassus, Strain CT5" /LENGTH=349 /DNA_ID=CAMNT_0042416491 /DNA_START=14 /DNA_END=1063 /DNA_ORIENTATION=-